MKKILTIGTLGAAGIVGAGLLTFPGMALAGAGDDDAAAKREDGVAELVLVDDQDDDDTADNTRSRNSRASRATRNTTVGAGTDRRATAQDVTKTRGSRPSRGTTDASATDVSRDAPSKDTSRDLSNDTTTR